MKIISIITAALSISGLMHAQDSPAAGKASNGTHLFILSGQSNMHHMRAEDSFTPAVAKAFGESNITIAKSAKRGAPIRMWDKDYPWPEGKAIPQGRKRPDRKEIDRETYLATFGQEYDKLIAEIRKQTEGKTHDTVTFVWMQGESDAGQKIADQYPESFERVIARLKADLKITSMNIVIGRICDANMDNPDRHKLREFQVKYAEQRSHSDWVNTDDLNDVQKNGEVTNDPHYTKEGYKIFGQRCAEKAIALIKAN